MKSWKKRWNEELDKIVPELRSDIKNAPFPGVIAQADGGNTAALARNRQKIIALTVLFTGVVCLFIACFLLFKPKNRDSFLFQIEINPSVCISTDENGMVTGVIGTNADADTLLSAADAEENIIGLDVDDAIVYYTDYAIKLGYLDVTTSGSAVRITACGGENLLEKSEFALENYFTAKGIYSIVVTESVGEAEFAGRSGLPSRSAQAMAEYVTRAQTLYTQRNAEGLTIQEMQSFYKENVLDRSLLDLTQRNLKDHLELIRKNAADIENLCDLYGRIYRHEDNPATLLKDYWEVKKIYGDTATGEFSDLMSAMDEALENYEADYGVKITNYVQLQNAAKSYLDLSVEYLEELLRDFTAKVFDEHFSALKEIMSACGIADDSFDDLLRLPETVEEYYEKTTAAMESEYNYRLDRYKDVYDEFRAPLSEAEYDVFVSSVIEQYGSLHEYWEALKK